MEMNTAEKHIRSIIENRGYIAINEFMRVVVPYYYENNIAIGKEGDFITAPEISQMFGEMIATYFINQWMNSSHTERCFNLVEMGPGNGTLMADVLRSIKKFPSVYSALNKVYLYEGSQRLRSTQRQKLSLYKNVSCVWIEDMSEVALHEGEVNFIICNEFFDCLPIKQFVNTEEGLRERIIISSQDKLKFALSEVTAPVRGELYNVLETATSYDYFVEQMVRLLSNSFSCALVIDYGYCEALNKSTLQALYKHQHIDPLNEIGNADVTTLVNFGYLAEQFKKCKCETELVSQRDFLLGLGIKERAKQLTTNVRNNTFCNIDGDLHRLISTEHMGELFKVLMVR